MGGLGPEPVTFRHLLMKYEVVELVLMRWFDDVGIHVLELRAGDPGYENRFFNSLSIAELVLR